MKPFRKADRYGLQRVLSPVGVLPQQAEKLDPALPIAEDELLIEVESLNIDSASFHQISEAEQGDLKRIQEAVVSLVERRGKHHNPVTGSGGMLIGRVIEVGPRFPIQEKPVKKGDRIATLVSLTLTPLKIQRIKQIHPKIDRIDVEGHAILFASGIFAHLPDDIPESVSLALLDVAGAPAQTRRLVQPHQTVLVIGGGGKSGLLCLSEAKNKQGVTTLAVDFSDSAIRRLKALSFVDHVIQVDARKAVEVMARIAEITQGRMADVVINVANLPETEMSSILSCKRGGTVYFFSMATSFSRAALGAEGVGADVDLKIGNGYTPGHAELAFSILRKNSEIRKVFFEMYQ